MTDQQIEGTCASVSLKGHRCVKTTDHDGDHSRQDGRTWPDGQTWRDVVAEYCQAQGIDPDNEDAYR